MSESNNVKFVEENGKWLWKQYDENGSVVHRSIFFDTEREARENYEISDLRPTPNTSGQSAPSTDAGQAEVAPSTEAGQPQESAAEGTAESTVGTATGEENQQAENDNSAGSASL